MRQGSPGFTLLELCIVLVIVALIIGGILVGRSMIHAAEVRSIVSDISKYSDALNNFRGKYQALPGDMKNAVRFWGAVTGGTADGQDAACIAYFDAAHTKTQATCNGNGNGLIPVTGNWHEAWRGWQHLANAGMISGLYTGQGAGASGTPAQNDSKLEYSSPSSRINNLTYLFLTEDTATAAHTFKFAGEYGLTLLIGTDSELDAPALKAADAEVIDAKLDNGKPGTGVIRAYKNSVRPHCSSTDDPLTALYTTADEEIGCNLYYIMKQ